MSFSNINIHNFVVENKLIFGNSLLDVGTGYGALAYLMDRNQEYKYVKKVAIEISSSAENFNNKHKLYEEFYTFNSVNIDEKKYDAVCAFKLLEHLMPHGNVIKSFLYKLESLACMRVILSVPAPYMTYNRGSMKQKLLYIENRQNISDEETVEIFADMHKQIIYPNELKSYGYMPAFNMNIKTISGSSIFYKDINKNENKDNPYSLFELLNIENYLLVWKKNYCNNDKIDNRNFLIKFIGTLLNTTKVFYFEPLIPSVIYNLKVYFSKLIGK